MASKNKYLMTLISKFLIKYKNCCGIIDENNNITLKKYYELISHGNNLSYDKLQKKLNSCEYKSCFADEMIIKLISKIYNISVDIISDTGIITINNSRNRKHKTIMLYKKDNYYIPFYQIP